MGRSEPFARVGVVGNAVAVAVALLSLPALAQPAPGPAPPPPAAPAPQPAQPAPPPPPAPAPAEPAPAPPAEAPPVAPAQQAPTAVAAPEAGEQTRPALPPPPTPSDEATGTEFRPRFVLETGRSPIAPPRKDRLRLQIHGEYQARFTLLSDLPLRQFGTEPGTSSLGQTARLYHWARWTPRLSYRDKLNVIGQIDVPRGYFVGQDTNHVDTAEEAYDEKNPIRVAPRWLYLEYLSPIGLFRVGQQPSHWGMGILANDGDHPTLFGDYFGGSISERLAFATKPLGKESPWVVAVAGDLVFKDATADLTQDDRAFQGVFATYYEDKHDNMIGFYGVYRHQQRNREALAGREFEETLNVWVLDSAGQFNAKIPGVHGHVFGEYEIAYLLGDTNYIRTLSQVRNNEREDVRALGAALRLGAVTTSGMGDDRWGKFVATLEWGWAQGDANPNDGVSRRFRFDPNHNVGLILFDEVMNWKTARAAAIGEDAGLTARAAPGLDWLPSNGAIFGATYLYPTVVYRPVRPLDLKLGAVIAQTTADFVDPVRVATGGEYVNYDGGDPKSHDLGVEIDGGVEYRLALDYEMTLQLGAQGGVLFPGKAFAGPNGDKMDNQYLAQLRLGLQY